MIDLTIIEQYEELLARKKNALSTWKSYLRTNQDDQKAFWAANLRRIDDEIERFKAEHNIEELYKQMEWEDRPITTRLFTFTGQTRTIGKSK